MIQTNDYPAYPCLACSTPRRCHGVTAVTALAAMVVVLVLVVGMMTAAMQTVLRGNQQRNLSAATYLAEAGLQYGYWQYSYNTAALPYNGSFTLPSGTFTVQVVSNSVSIPHTIKITATGTHNTTKSTLTRIYNIPSTGNHIFDYALLVNQSLSTNWYPVLGSGSSGGDIRVNGSISLPNSQSTINGSATASGSISIPTVTGLTTPNSLPYSFPALSAAYYQTIAGASYTFTGLYAYGPFYFASPNQTIYVNGDVSVAGGTVVNGTGTVFVNGNFTLNGSWSYASNSHIAILVSGTMTISSSATSIIGSYYVHNSSGTARTIINGPITSWKGSLVTDTITFNGGSSAQLAITKDIFFTSSQGKTMYIPGY